MSDLKKKIHDAISESLGSDLNEAYVAEPKKFQLQTELLSNATKQAQKKEFEQFVSALNQVSAELDGADRENANNKTSEFRSLKLDEVYNMNASFLRALYFENISDLNSKITMDMLSFLRLERDFGTFDEWQRDFMACCMVSRDGYAITGYSMFLKRYMNFVVDEEAKNVGIGVVPIIVMDMNVGAYWRDYLDDKKAYVRAMMKELNWDRVEKRFKRAEQIAKLIRVDEGG